MENTMDDIPATTPAPVLARQVVQDITWYINGVEESTVLCTSPSVVLSQGGAFICEEPPATSSDGEEFNGYSTACMESSSGSDVSTAVGGGECEGINCLRCGQHCGTHYIPRENPQQTPLSQLFCLGIPNYVETWYSSPFLRQIDSATSQNVAPPVTTEPPVTQTDEDTSPASQTASLCPDPGSSSPSSGTMAAIAVPSILGTLALASIIFFFILRHRTQKLMNGSYGAVSNGGEKPGTLIDPNGTTLHRRLSQ